MPPPPPPRRGDSDASAWGRGIRLPTIEAGVPGSLLHIKFNPYVTVYSCAIIWSFIAYSLAERWLAYKEFQTWFYWVTDNWTWFYVATQNVWIIVLLYLLCIPRYRNLKLGLPEDEPEFLRLQWFAMLFCCGVAVIGRVPSPFDLTRVDGV